MKNTVIIAALVLIAVAVVFITLNQESEVDPFSLYYEGEARHFRANLLEADMTPVFPNEDSIRQILLNPEVFKIHIAYIPNDVENAFYLASSFEITNKLGLVYRHYFRGDVDTFKDVDGSNCLLFFDNMQTRCFSSLPINSTEELVPTSVEPVILLLGPSQTQNTQVVVENNMITLEGGNFSEIDRKYTDLDLAVDKMLLVMLLSD